MWYNHCSQEPSIAVDDYTGSAQEWSYQQPGMKLGHRRLYFTLVNYFLLIYSENGGIVIFHCIPTGDPTGCQWRV